MENKFKLAIPKPCHEDWDKMIPDETGRFCTSCSKSVVDFTGMNASEIHEYFIKNQGQRVCGRFKNKQLDSVIIRIPKEVVFSNPQFHKAFMLALLVCMGTTLFSCQNTYGNKLAIEKVEVIDSIQQAPQAKTKTKLPEKKKKSTKKKATQASIIMGDIAVPDFTTGKVAVTNYETPPKEIKPDVYTAAGIEKAPSFPGGLEKFYEYFKANFKTPEDSKDITIRIFFSFIVNIDGSLSDIKLLRGINESVNKEAIRVLQESPKWIPGEQGGEKVRVIYSIPIKITAKE